MTKTTVGWLAVAGVVVWVAGLAFGSTPVALTGGLLTGFFGSQWYRSRRNA